MIFAITASVLAGLASGLGGAIALFIKRPGGKTMSLSLGFASGVMLTVSLSDMLPHSIHTYSTYMGSLAAALAACSLCALGMFSAMLLAKLVPEFQVVKQNDNTRNAKALKSAVIITLALIAHNLPEGVLTLFTAAQNHEMGLQMALAVALHNIPEGIAIAVPIYYATGSKFKGFLLALASGIAEPVGALLAFGVLSPYLSGLFLNGVISVVAGIMLFVSFSELFSEALNYGKNSFAVLGVCMGILIMQIGLYLV